VFRARFYRPDLVGEILDTLDVWEAQKLADKAIGRRPEASDINDLLPPVIQIIAPQQGSKISQTSVTLSYHVRSAPTPLRGVRIAIDGRPISYQDRADLRCMDNRDCEGAVTISVPKKDVTITMIAESAVAASEPAELRLNWSGSQEQIKSKPNLYLLAVGVSHHSDPELDVKYASVDAQAFADVVRKQQDGIYANINMRIVLDESARLADIKEGLVWLKDNVRPTDVAMVFLAGQSKQRSATNYDFLPFDADSKRPELTFLHDFDLEYFLSNIPGKAFLFVDSCYAGGLTKFVASSSAPADINRLANNLAQNGVVVFTASASQQVALESDEWRHGAFTKALLEGLSGEAAGSSSKTISVSELASYVSNRVETLTAGRQTPSIAKPTFVPDAPIAAVVR
jgi:caspase domain-containing protein